MPISERHGVRSDELQSCFERGASRRRQRVGLHEQKKGNYNLSVLFHLTYASSNQSLNTIENTIPLGISPELDELRFLFLGVAIFVVGNPFFLLGEVSVGLMIGSGLRMFGSKFDAGEGEVLRC